MFNFIIEVKKGYSVYSGSYDYSNSAETQQELFDVSVSSFFDALAMDEILSYDQKAILLELEQMLGYDKLCDYAKQLDGVLSEEDMVLLINGMDIQDVIMVNCESHYVSWNNQRYHEKFCALANEKWEKIWETIKRKADLAVRGLIPYLIGMDHNYRRKEINRNLASEFKGYVEIDDELYNKIYRKTKNDFNKYLPESEFYKSLLLNLTEQALKASYSEQVRPSKEEMGSLKIIPFNSSSSENDDDEGDYSFAVGDNEETFSFKPIAPCANRVIVVKGSSSSAYCND